MKPIITLLDGYTILKPAEKKLVLNDILLQKNVLDTLFYMLSIAKTPAPVRRACTAVLCDTAVKERYARKVFRQFTPALAQTLLKDADPKVRKGLAKLVGIANKKEYSIALIDTIKAEETEFVLDSLILALGYTNYSKRATDFLKDYTLKCKTEKHLSKEKLAVQKALASLTKHAPILDFKLNGASVLLPYSSELPDALKTELDERNVAYLENDLLKSALSVIPENYSDIFYFRCFFEALVVIGSYDRNHSLDFIDDIFNKIDKLLNLESYQLRFDLQYLDPADKKTTMETLLNKCEGSKFSSSPSNYQFELRLYFEVDKVKAFLSVPSIDTRFNYRKQTIPASINPVIAASMMRTLLPYFKIDATVLDPFCGSGTLLFERDTLLPCEELIGVDIRKETIYKAKINMLNEDIPVSFLVSDILNADFVQEFDEVIANMPFGRRVSSHDENSILYFGFVKTLKTLLKNNGYAFLYTNEKQLLINIIKGDVAFEIEKEIIIESGGLYPSLFIIKKIR